MEQQGLGRMTFEGPCFRATGMSDARIEHAPQIGEHNRAICREILGLDEAEIDELVASGAIDAPIEAVE